jgi:hypothetical protein
MAFVPWTAGSLITAAKLAAMTPLWSAWTPTWTAVSGSPAYGNATVDCKYAQSADTVFFEMEITFGSTTTYGDALNTANWSFSLPVTASETQLIAGMGEIQDGTAVERWPVRARIATTTTFQVELSGRNYNDTANANNGIVDAVTPMTWASTDRILLHGHYQAA